MNSTILYIASYNKFCKDNNYENHYRTLYNNVLKCLEKTFTCKCFSNKKYKKL